MHFGTIGIHFKSTSGLILPLRRLAPHRFLRPQTNPCTPLPLSLLFLPSKMKRGTSTIDGYDGFTVETQSPIRLSDTSRGDNSRGYCKSGGCSVGDEDCNSRAAILSCKPLPGGGDPEPSTNCNTSCIKCKVNETISHYYPSIASGGDVGRFCIDCFRGHLFGKFRFAVTSNAMILPSDNVLVAFSGGASSRVALEFVHKMQQKAQKNFEASRDRSLPVFGVGVAFIDERASFPFPSDDFNGAISEMSLIVSSLAPPAKQFHVVPTEVIFSPNFATGRAKLTELIDAVGDVTGREDFLEYLRMLSLQKIATENGYTKLVLGTSTSRIACHVLEATVKGQGFSLAADIQYADARWEIPVVLPLRDCLSEELNMLCSLESLKAVETLRQPCSGINGLISAFVKLLQKENPSRESTILRTAGKLTPFCFNTVPDVDDHKGYLASQRKHKKYNLNESLPPESFCLICRSPLMKSGITALNSFEDAGPKAGILLTTCSSCQYQILPKDPSSLEYFHSLLPQSMTSLVKNNYNSQKCLREQIQDCLLSDRDEGT